MSARRGTAAPSAGLRLGVIPRGDDNDALERELVAALTDALTQPVGVHRAADYRVVLSGLEQGLVDFAWLPPLVAARALRRRVAEPLAVAVRHGVTTYNTVLVTHPDSTIRTIVDLRAVRVAWVDRQSASGYVILRAALARAGVRLVDAFSDELFLRSHAAVARAVIDGQVDVGATCAHARTDAGSTGGAFYAGVTGLYEGTLRTVFEAGPIPSDIFAVRTSVPAPVRQALTEGLLRRVPARVHAAARAFMSADGFSAPTPEHSRMLDVLLVE